MEEIINGIGKFINDTTRMIMRTPEPPRPQPQMQLRPQGVPCSTCGQGAVQNAPQNPNGVVFNADRAPASASIRQQIQEPNLRDRPYINNSGLKFN